MSAKIVESIEIAAAQMEVFDFSQDYTRRLEWDTFLREARLVNAEQADKGVRAWCVSRQGLGMEAEYVSYIRPKVTAVKMTRGPWLFQSFAGSWQFEALTDNRTNVTFTYSYTLRFPFNLLQPLVHFILVKEVKGRLRDLKNWMEKTS